MRPIHAPDSRASLRMIFSSLNKRDRGNFFKHQESVDSLPPILSAYSNVNRTESLALGW